MGNFKQIGSLNIYEGTKNMAAGSLKKLLSDFGAELIIGHPTLRNEGSIGALLNCTIKGASNVFTEKKVAIINVDSSFSKKGNEDHATIDAAIKGAEESLSTVGVAAENILFVSLPIEGYAENFVVHKGSALKIIFDEMEGTNVKNLILLDGDLKNDISEWMAVYKRVFADHEEKNPGKDLFISARYARHFVDASLTRFVVGPLTTIMGKYVPGGISGDIVLNEGAVKHEREANWDEARMCYGTDISTTFDNIANNTIIYEVYLGAKLHDITDDAKLAVMPGEVIGSALERILHYEKLDGRISKLLKSNEEAGQVIEWGPDKTGIDFIDPGKTNVFNIDAKRNVLITKYPDFEEDIKRVLTSESFSMIKDRYTTLADSVKNNNPEGELFLGVDKNTWTGLLYESLGYLLKTEDIDSTKRALNYLYTSAFLEFCKEKLEELGATTVEQIKAIQSSLGVEKNQAEPFYTNKVDNVVKSMALEFFSGRKAILNRMNSL